MGSEYTFYDYVDADRGGVNVVKRWLNSDGKKAKAFFTMLIPTVDTHGQARGTKTVQASLDLNAHPHVNTYLVP